MESHSSRVEGPGDFLEEVKVLGRVKPRALPIAARSKSWETSCWMVVESEATVWSQYCWRRCNLRRLRAASSAAMARRSASSSVEATEGTAARAVASLRSLGSLVVVEVVLFSSFILGSWSDRKSTRL